MKIDSITGEILEKNGVKSDSINRKNIGEETKEKLREAETVKDIKEYLARIHDIDL